MSKVSGRIDIARRGAVSGERAGHVLIGSACRRWSGAGLGRAGLGWAGLYVARQRLLDPFFHRVLFFGSCCFQSPVVTELAPGV